MRRALLLFRLAVATISFLAGAHALAQSQDPALAPNDLPLFAIEITIGAKWDQSKPPQEQLYFRDHSSNLKKLRDSGALIMGARYSDKGLVVLAAKDETSARAMMDDDPSIRAEIFKYQIHSFNVFYGGTVITKIRRVAQ
jgi:uncharacterized protein YciI